MAMKLTETRIKTYSTVINDFHYLQEATRYVDKERAIKQLADFLHSEGYEQLAEILVKKKREITHHA